MENAFEKVREGIQWVLDNQTSYRVAKDLGINNRTINRYQNGETPIGNMTIVTAEKIYNYYLEVMEMEKILEVAKKEIEKQIEAVGFIDDSDNVDRFIDTLAEKLASEKVLKGNDDPNFLFENEIEKDNLAEKLIEEIKEKIMCEYDKIYSNEQGDFEGYYYKKDFNFVTLEEFYGYFKLVN